jgi:hypothetical protein
LHKNIVQGILLIYVVLFPATSLHAAEAKDCQLKRYASLDLSGLRNGYLLVPVTIQGSHAFMILNIANAFSSITENAASRLALQIKRIPFGADVSSRSTGTPPNAHCASALSDGHDLPTTLADLDRGRRSSLYVEVQLSESRGAIFGGRRGLAN